MFEGIIIVTAMAIAVVVGIWVWRLVFREFTEVGRLAKRLGISPYEAKRELEKERRREVARRMREDRRRSR